MAGFHSFILLLALVVAPLSTYAQHGGHGGGGGPPAGYTAYNGYNPGRPTTTAAAAPVESSSTTEGSNPSPVEPTSNPTPPVESTAPSSGGGGGGGGPPAGYTAYSGNHPHRPTTTAAAAPIESSPTTEGSNPSPVQPTSNPTAPVESPAPSSGGGSCTGSGMEIEWSGDSVSYSWSGGSGTTTGCLSLGSSFEGQVAVGGSGGTIFEGNPSGYFDVSFILGWSVPMLCSSGSAKTGCSIDLSSKHSCPDQQGSICKNPTGPGGSHDPGSYNGCASCTPWCYACSAPDPFFQPCSGSAYTYPYDDGATVGPASGAIKCCIGTSCGSTGREGSTAGGHAEPTRNPPCDLCSGGSKRSVEEELDEVFKRAEDMPAMSPSLMPRRHKRSAHRHAVVRGLKALI
ncbi:hypothetical protein JMJ35_005239 [Cladonia borealis]|uniref:Uncharacterized protein n=1 Tax=Cladonia borealis TaxID=184061 RepID=A0AA39UA59_9LECA|nr:hypothetical protein JMJ35_005239 [Cladonia borealis]